MPRYDLGGDRPIATEDLRQLLEQQGRIWLHVRDPGSARPFIQSGDAIRIAGAATAPTGLAVIDRDGYTSLAFRRIPSPSTPATGWVDHVWRRPVGYDLTRRPWRRLLAFGAGPRTLTFLQQGARVFLRARSIPRQLGPPPSPETISRAEARAYSAASAFESYRSGADRGLSTAEELLLGRYLHPGDRLLDIGCGAGREAFGFAAHGIHVTAVDVCEALVDAARQEALKHADLDVSFEVMSLTQLRFPPASFDAVFVSPSVYATIPGRIHRIEALRRCEKIVRDGGIVMLPVVVAENESKLAKIAVDAPRRLLRPFLGDRVAEPGDRRVQLFPDAPLPSFQHRFASEGEILGEITAAGFSCIDRLHSYFVLSRSNATRIRRYVPRETVRAERVGDEILLVDLERGTTFRLNQNGARIWSLLAAGLDAETIAGEIDRSVAMSPGRSTIDHDTQTMIRALVEHGLVQLDDETGPPSPAEHRRANIARSNSEGRSG